MATATRARSERSRFQPSDNPVTVDNVSRNDRLAELAKAQHPRILATYGGEYSDPKLERMVAKVVGNLTMVSGNPNQTYRITILNSPNVNAFALPGGYLYVTRGLLALANDSAELAAVIAHEMGHVTANHGVAAPAAGSRGISPPGRVRRARRRAGKQALIRGKLRLAQFSRNQELEADAIGIKTPGQSGYDPFAAARFLQSLPPIPISAPPTPTTTSLDFLASHPNAPQRIELAQSHARQFGAPGIGDARPRLLPGRHRRAAVRRHPGGGLCARQHLPASGPRHLVLGAAAASSIDNNKAAVLAAGPGEFAIRFDGVDVAENVPLTDYVKSGWVAGLIESSVSPTRSTAMRRPWAQRRPRAGSLTSRSCGSGRVYRLLTAAPVQCNERRGRATASRRASTAQSEQSGRAEAAAHPHRHRQARRHGGLACRRAWSASTGSTSCSG